MDVSVATAPLALLNSQLGAATDAQVEFIASRISTLARRMSEKIQSNSPFFLPFFFDSNLPAKQIQVQQLEDAIQQLQDATDTDSRKAAIIYLQATVETLNTFAPPDDSIASQALEDFGAGVAKLIEELAKTVAAIAKPLLPDLAPLTTTLEWAIVAIVFIGLIVVSLKWGKA